MVKMHRIMPPLTIRTPMPEGIKPARIVVSYSECICACCAYVHGLALFRNDQPLGYLPIGCKCSNPEATWKIGEPSSVPPPMAQDADGTGT